MTRRSALTVLELVVVIAIAGVLLAIALPAVQTARETARQTHCQNNLKQIGLSVQQFSNTHKHFPSNGWGFAWVGVPGRGFAKDQPGGWLFQLRTFIEPEGFGSVGEDSETSFGRQRLSEYAAVAWPLIKCPSRPTPELGPNATSWLYRNADLPEMVAKTDYAINEGDFITNTRGGPQTIAQGEGAFYPWTPTDGATGVSWLRGSVRFADLIDGASNTYLAGEKFVGSGGYGSNTDLGYDQTWMSGVDLDLNRWTISGPTPDFIGSSVEKSRNFGSAHPGVFHMLYCDGAVVSLAFSIDPVVHREHGNRHDSKASP